METLKPTGGKQLNELLRSRGFKLGAVAAAIGVNKNAMNYWKNTAPVDKLFRISQFTHIPITEIIECFRPEDMEQQRDDPSN